MIIFSIFQKKFCKSLVKSYKNFVTFCDDVINGGVINDDVILFLSKHVFIIKKQLCQSFQQLVKAFRFEAKKIEGGRLFNTPCPILEASRVKY